jgi:hypothetical protein
MVQIWQFHDLHFISICGWCWNMFGKLGRRPVGRMRRRRHAWHFHHPSESRLLRSPHEQQDWQVIEEHGAYPRWHPVSPRATEVPIDDDNSD